MKFAAGKSRGSGRGPKSYEIKKRKSDRAGPLFWSSFNTKTFYQWSADTQLACFQNHEG